MNQPQPDEVIHRYLLGLSSEAESDEVERYYLIDADGYERLGAAEDELVEDYLDGRMDAEERRGFEYHFLNATERRQKLNFARSLRAVVLRVPDQMLVETTPARRAPYFKLAAVDWMPWAVAATLAIALLGCGLLLVENRQFSKRASLLRVEKENLAGQNDELRRELQTSATQSSSPPRPLPSELTVISAMLSPGLTRSDVASRRIFIPPKANLAKFELELLASDYRLYRAIVRLAGGEELVTQSNLKPSSRHVIVLVPTDMLRSGDYQILLAGKTADGDYEPAATYSFRITR